MDVEVTDKQVNERLEQLKKQFYGGDDKKFKASLKKLLLTEDQVKKDVRAQLLEEQLYKKVTEDLKGQRQGNRGLLHQEQGAVPAGRYARFGTSSSRRRRRPTRSMRSSRPAATSRT